METRPVNLWTKYWMIPVVLIVGFFSFPREAAATFSLSVSPERGVRSIDFEQSKPGTFLRNEEVTLTVTSTLASQYTIYQTVYQPLTNDLGNTIPQENFIMFSPSTSLGTLKAQLETPVQMGQIPVYTSNAAGDSDTFVLVYNVKVPENQPGGVYHTQITFTAQTVNAQGGVSPSLTTLDVRVDIRPTFSVMVQNSAGGRDLNLGHLSKDRLEAQEILKIELESNSGPYRITQHLSEPLTSPEGEVMDESNFKFTSFGGDNGNLTGKNGAEVMPVSPGPLYVTDTGAGDKIQVQYTVSPPVAQKAGIYSGMLQLKVEPSSQSTAPEIFNIPVKIEVDTLFYLDVEMDEPGRVQFGTLKAKGDKRQKKARLEVYSNVGLPYQVTQIVSSQLVNEMGQTIPNEYFTYSGSDAQSGTLSHLAPAPVTEGESVVFTSDNKGTPEKFTLDYELSLPQNPKSGNYSSRVKYSLTSL